MAAYLKTLKKHDYRQTCILNAAMGVLCLFLFMRKSLFNKEVKITVASRYGHFREKWHIYDKTTDNSEYFLVKVKYVAMKMKFSLWFSKTLFK